VDHRIPYDHDDPEGGGPTCECNLQPLCRTHHRLKTAGLITPHPMPSEDGGSPLGTLLWSTATAHTYRHDPAPPLPGPADPDDVALAAAARARRRLLREFSTSADPDLDEGLGMPNDENWASEEWKKSLHEARRASKPPPPAAATSLPRTPQDPPF
jgi:hypothetical protein